MRVLLIPEVYRPGDLSANGTVADETAWVERWLDLDPTLHVYRLLPPSGDAYEPADVLADRERVTLVEAESPMAGDAYESLFTEEGYSREQLYALRRHVHDQGAYVDVVVDGLRVGRPTLYKWLLEHSDHWAAQVQPFDVVANVHDLQLPFKYRWCSYRNDFQFRMEACSALFADGVWFKAGVDARHLRERASEFLRPEVVDAALSDAVETGSPIDLSHFEERYRERPRWLHLAGSMWAKKRTDSLFAVARRLREEYGVRTVLTSMEDVPEAYAASDWVEAHPNADRETYERALRKGDLALCASEYETMARTPFEQAASGQVLVLRDEPWVHDCVPDDHPLLCDAADLGERAAWVVEHWEEAVAANRDLVEHVRRVRSPDRAGRRTYDDLRSRVEGKRERFSLAETHPAVRRAVADLDGETVALDEFIARTAEFAADGRPVTEREDVAFVDLVYALRVAGYEDAGNPGTPVFRPRTTDPASVDERVAAELGRRVGE